MSEIKSRLVIDTDAPVKGLKAVADQAERLLRTLQKIEDTGKSTGQLFGTLNRFAAAGLVPGGGGGGTNWQHAGPGGGGGGYTTLVVANLTARVQTVTLTGVNVVVQGVNGGNFPGFTGPVGGSGLTWSQQMRLGLQQQVYNHPGFGKTGLSAGSLAQLPDEDLLALNQRLGGGKGGGGRRAPDPGGGLGVARVLAAGYAGLRSVETVGEGWNAATSVRIMGGSRQEQIREYLRETVPGFDRAFRAYRNFQGAPSEVEAENQESAVRVQQNALRLERDRSVYEARARMESAAALASPTSRALSLVRPGYSRFDTLTTAGRVGYEREGVLAGIGVRAREQMYAADAAAKERQMAEERLRELEDRRAHLVRQERRYTTASGAPRRNPDGSPVDQTIQVNRVREIQDELEKVGRQLADAGRAAAEKRQGSAGAERQLGEMRLESREARLGFLRQDIDVTRGTAQRLGGMNRFERQRGVQALEFVLQHGINNVPPEILAEARAVAPSKVSDLETQAGAASPEFQRLSKLAPEDVRVGNLAGAARTAGKEAEAIAVERQKIIDDFKKAEAESFKGIGKSFADLGTLIRQVLDEAITQLKSDLLNQRNQQMVVKGSGR